MVSNDRDDQDSALSRIRQKRLAQLKREAASQGEHYGVLMPVSHEKELVHMTSQVFRLVIHFRMPSFRRCQIMSEHLEKLAKLYPKTKFVEANAEEMVFLVAKFKVQVLPCLVVIIGGNPVDKYDSNCF
jgi:thioredoxin-like negative regulator of GroEL